MLFYQVINFFNSNRKLITTLLFFCDQVFSSKLYSYQKLNRYEKFNFRFQENLFIFKAIILKFSLVLHRQNLMFRGFQWYNSISVYILLGLLFFLNIQKISRHQKNVPGDREYSSFGTPNNSICPSILPSLALTFIFLFGTFLERSKVQNLPNIHMLAKTLLERPFKNLTLFSTGQALFNIKLNTTSKIELLTTKPCQHSKSISQFWRDDLGLQQITG